MVYGPDGVGTYGGEVATDSSMIVFAPFETKRWLFEFRVGSQFTRNEVTPGKYRVRGEYAHQPAAYDTVTVEQ